MRFYSRSILLLPLLFAQALFTQCDIFEPEEELPVPEVDWFHTQGGFSLVGPWYEAVDVSNRDDPVYAGNCEDSSWEFIGRWEFRDNNTYWYNIEQRAVDHLYLGFSSGVYNLIENCDQFALLTA